MLARLRNRLAYASSPLLRRLFGFPASVLEANRAVHERIMDRVERRVWGPSGLAAYESAERSLLARAARRSLAQYLCYREIVGDWRVNLIRAVGFALALPSVAVVLTIKSLGGRPRAAASESHAVVLFFLAPRLENCLGPDFFAAKPYRETRTRPRFGPPEWYFVCRAIAAEPRLLTTPELLVNLLRWTAYYSYVLVEHRPAVVANFFERTASSSLMTALCEDRGARHLDLQHGELNYSSLGAFCEFHEIRLWGDHMRSIFEWRRCRAEEVHVGGNPYHRHLFDEIRQRRQPRPPEVLVIDPFVHATGDAQYEKLVEIIQCLGPGWAVRIRPHPAQQTTGATLTERLQSEPALADRTASVTEESSQSLPIAEALANSRIVIGVASAALIEAWVAGCKVIHLPGLPHRQSLMSRYRDSPNVLYAGSDDDIRKFVGKPALLDDDEDRRVDYVSSVFGENK